MSRSEPVAHHLQLHEELGRGATCRVFRAWYRGRLVAVKQSHTGDPHAAQRLRRDAAHSRRVHHPNVAPVLEVLESDHGLAVIVPLAVGGSLADRLRDELTLPPARTVAIASQVAHGLQAVHDAGLLHRDVKPANVLLGVEGTAVLSDLASAIPAASLTDGATVPVEGSAGYLAPELVAGAPPSVASDIYALGVTMFETLTGRLPYAGVTAAEIADAARGAGRPLDPLVPGLPAPLSDLVHAAIDPEPSRRPACAREVAEHLEALVPLLDGWTPDPDAALAAWSTPVDPRSTRVFGPRPAPPTSPGAAAHRPPSPWLVAAASLACLAGPPALVTVLS